MPYISKRTFIYLAAMLCIPLFFSCHSDIELPPPLYSYCVFDAERTCELGNFTVCPPGGELSYTCPYDSSYSSSILTSSSSIPTSSSSVVQSSSSIAPSSSSIVPSSSSAIPISSSLASSSSSVLPSSSSMPMPSSSSVPQISSSSRGTFTDTRDGKTYKWVKIGTQTWMAQNLNYNTSTAGSKCYSYNEDNCTTYGRLYNWETAVALPNCNINTCASQITAEHQGICPEGWHLPSDAEWATLIDFAGGEVGAGTKLKTDSWYPNNGTDDFGFSALPGGFGYYSGGFNQDGQVGDWWSTSEYNDGYAYEFGMNIYNPDYVYWGNFLKGNFVSVRCVQD